MNEEFWRTRNESIDHLRSTCGDRVRVTEELLNVIDSVIDAFEKNAAANTYSRICGVTLVKAKHLAIGAYSLVLDGLGQEAGALVRPFIEYVELLTYFTKFPEGVELALEKKLPSAGKRAMLIEGEFQGLREFLNQHASHSSYDGHALNHLIVPGENKFKKEQPMVAHVLEFNLLNFTMLLYLLLVRAVRALDKVDARMVASLASTMQELQSQAIVSFQLNRASPETAQV